MFSYIFFIDVTFSSSEEHKKECPINKEDDNDTTASNATNAISSSNAQPAASAIEPPNISSRSFGQKEKVYNEIYLKYKI